MFHNENQTESHASELRTRLQVLKVRYLYIDGSVHASRPIAADNAGLASTCPLHALPLCILLSPALCLRTCKLVGSLCQGDIRIWMVASQQGIHLQNSEADLSQCQDIAIKFSFPCRIPTVNSGAHKSKVVQWAL